MSVEALPAGSYKPQRPKPNPQGGGPPPPPPSGPMPEDFPPMITFGDPNYQPAHEGGDQGEGGIRGYASGDTINFGGQEWVRDGPWLVPLEFAERGGIDDPELAAEFESLAVPYAQGLNRAAGERKRAVYRSNSAQTGGMGGTQGAVLARSLGYNMDTPIQGKNMSLWYAIENGHYLVHRLPDGRMFLINAGQSPDSPNSEFVDPGTGARFFGLHNAPGGGGTGGGTPQIPGLPRLARGARVDPIPGGRRVMINGVPAIVAEANETEYIIPQSKLEGAVGREGAARVAAAVDSPVTPGSRLAYGGTAPWAQNPGFWDPNDPGLIGAPPPTGPTAAGVNPGRLIYVGPTPAERMGLPPGVYRPGNPAEGAPPVHQPGPGPAGPAPPPGTTTPTSNFPDPASYGGTEYSPFGGYAPASYTPYQERDMTPEEKQQLAAITALARMLEGQGKGLYDVGSGAYAQAIKYYQTLLGGNRAAMTSAVAPSAEMIREQGRGAEERVRAGLGRSGAADTAIADLARTEAGQIAELTRGVQPGAAAALQAGGLAGAQTGGALQQAAGGFYEAARQALTQHRQFEEGLGESSRQFGAGLTEQSRQFGTGLEEQSRQFAASLAEQVRMGNIGASQAAAALALQTRVSDQNYQIQLQELAQRATQFAEQMQLMRQQFSFQKKMGIGQMIGQGLGLIGKFMGK